MRCSPGHWLPCFCAVTHQMARNHKTSGFRVSWKIVPAVSDTWYPQPAQTSRLRLVIQLEVPRQRGQTKPSGQRSLSKYSRQARSVPNLASNSANVLGYPSSGPYHNISAYWSQLNTQNRVFGHYGVKAAIDRYGASVM